MTTLTQAFRSGITLPSDQIASLCEKYQVEELSIYGSVLRNDFGPDSDVDFLVVFKDGDAGPRVSKVFDLEKDLSTLLGRRVEVAAKQGVEQLATCLTRSAINDSAQVVYCGSNGVVASPGTGEQVGRHHAERESGIPPLILARIRFDPERIAEFCRRHHIIRLSLFGSVLRDDFSPESDVDVLVQFDPSHTPAWEFFGMQAELTALFGRRVDLNTPGFLSRYFRDQVQAEAQTLYESQTGID